MTFKIACVIFMVIMASNGYPYQSGSQNTGGYGYGSNQVRSLPIPGNQDGLPGSQAFPVNQGGLPGVLGFPGAQGGFPSSQNFPGNPGGQSGHHGGYKDRGY